MATTASNSSTGNPLLNIQDPSQGGSVQFQMMCTLAKAFEQGQKEQDAEPDPMIAYVEKAYVTATQNMSFEARQAYWKMLTTRMEGMPHQLQAFFSGQNDLFNNNKQLENLFKDLEKWESKLSGDQKDAAKDKEIAKHLAISAAKALGIPIVGVAIAAGLAIGAAVEYAKYLVKEGEVAHDAEKVQDLTRSVAGVEGAIEGQSRVAANELGNSASKAIGESNLVANSLTNLLKTNNSAADQICKSLNADGS